MKLATLGLTLFGLVAALCAGVLVNTLSKERGLFGGPAKDAAPEVQVLVASKDLPAIAVVDATCLSVKTLPRKEAPQGFYSNPVQVAGKVLCTSMVAGQPFLPPCFADEGSGFHVVSALREGMRAVSVALADYAGLEGLLYPGSIVDVVVSFTAPAEDGGPGHPMAITLLFGVRVLAIERQTIMSTPQGAAPEPGRSGNKRHKVTLAVDPKQAEVLQLAQEFGTISLTMRNPLDRALLKTGEGVALSQLAQEHFAKLLQRSAPQVSNSNPLVPTSMPAVPDNGENPAQGRTEPAGVAETPPDDSEPAPVPTWDTTIIRGDVYETVSFPLPTQ